MPRQRSSRCPIPGCILLISDDQTVCHPHALKIWREIQEEHLRTAGPAISTPSADQVATHRDDEARRRTKLSLSAGRIYYLRLDEKIKIGWTANLPQRMQAYPPHMVLLADHEGTRADERDLHRTFRSSLAAGREWYHPTKELLDQIDRAKAQAIRESQARHERWKAENPPPPVPAPVVRRSKPRPLRGGALVRAIIAGEVD